MSDALPGLTVERIDALASRWFDTGLWADIGHLADLFVTADRHDADQRWHHLVLAVGNFKRQGGHRLVPHQLHPPASPLIARPDAIDVPGVGQVQRDDPESWRRLGRQLPGAGIATTTTLLASIWSDDHFVFDWRVRAASNALRIAAGLDPTPSVADALRSGNRVASLSWDDYDSIRPWILATNAAATQVERALYELSRSVEPAPGRTWQTYAAEVIAKLHHLPTA